MAADAQQSELTETPSFLNHILDKTTQLCKIPFEVEPLEEHAVTLDKTISLLRKLEDCFQFEDNEKTQLLYKAGTIYCLELPLPQQLSLTWAQTDKQYFFTRETIVQYIF